MSRKLGSALGQAVALAFYFCAKGLLDLQGDGFISEDHCVPEGIEILP